MKDVRDEYRTFYKKELVPMIEHAAVAVIRRSPPDDSYLSDCPIANRLNGIFALLDEIMLRLDDPEVE